jgi:hypothetical protein
MASFSSGDTFLQEDDARSRHLHVVICDATPTDASVIVVSFNTVRGWTDRTLVLQPGDHPFITRETSVSYNRVTRISVAELSKKEADNQSLAPNFRSFLRQTPVSTDLLQKIRDGAVASPLTPKGMKREVKARLGIP